MVEYCKRRTKLAFSFAFLTLTLTLSLEYCLAWVSISRHATSGLHSHRRRFCSAKATANKAAASSDENDNKNNNNDASSARCRTSIAGVSVSENGFWVILQTGSDKYIPIQVTDDSVDASTATSPQALTVLQLLAKVDMAGAILPPDLLSRMVVLSCEEKEQTTTTTLSDVEKQVLQQVHAKLLPNNNNPAKDATTTTDDSGKTMTSTYSEQHQYPWMRSRIVLPAVTLDEVQLHFNCDAQVQFTLQCSVKNIGKLRLVPSESIMEQVSYQYRPDGISLAFTVIALALRYKAPIVVTAVEEELSNTAARSSSLTEIQSAFPMYRTASELQQTTQRVQKSIERGFEVNKMQAALRIARERGDDAAAAKIRVALDKMDSFQELPTLPETDIGSMQ